jgi:mRNA interferase MazF
MIAEAWDVVRVPFPFTDRDAVKKRPALVLSSHAFNAASGHTIMAMITKRGHSAWPADYDLQRWREAGLKFPSWVRLKIFTLENTLMIDKLGALEPVDVAGFQESAKAALW